MGWDPARKVSGGNWQAPWLIRTMDDPYSAVRYIAHKALMADPEFANTPFDFTAPLATRKAQIATAREQWSGAMPPGQTQQVEVLLDAQGKPLEDVAERLTRQRNNRPMTLQE